MNYNFNILDSVSFLVFTFILYYLSALSKRLGDAMGMKKYYYLYYAAMYFTFLAFIMITFSLGGENAIIYAHSSFALGLTFGLIASIKYWGWVIIESIKGK
jgi:hypothetical protein